MAGDSGMSLDQAIALLCRVHLKNLEDDDWAVRMGATPYGHEVADYVPAWEALRAYLLKVRQEAGDGG